MEIDYFIGSFPENKIINVCIHAMYEFLTFINLVKRFVIAFLTFFFII